MRSLVIACLLSAAACSDGSSYIVVSVDSAIGVTAASLDVTIENAGETGHAVVARGVSMPPAHSFVLKLEPRRRGDATITVTLLDTAGSPMLTAKDKVAIVPGGNARLELWFGRTLPDAGVPDAAKLVDAAAPADATWIPDAPPPDLAPTPDLAHRRQLAFEKVFTVALVGPHSAATGDFNGDGKLDIVLAGESSVSVLLGRGDGTFDDSIDSRLGFYNGQVAVGDLNGDGKADIALADASLSHTVSTAVGDGRGGFSNPHTLKLSGPTFHVALADLNSDGKLDYLFSLTDDMQRRGISVFLGAGDGVISGGVDYLFPTSQPQLLTADFNEDGHPDVLTASSASKDVVLLLGNGAGAFAPPSSFPLPDIAGPLVAADFDGDGHLDASIVQPWQNNVAVILGSGRGTLGAARTYFAGTTPVSLLSADLDRDGKIDLALGSGDSMNITVLLGAGDGSFPRTATFTGADKQQAIFSGDFNADGLPDIAATTAAHLVVLVNRSE